MKNKWMSLGLLIGMVLLAMLPGFSVEAAQTSAFTGEVDAYANEWYMEPWVWILSGGVFILLFSVILGREDNRDA